MFLVLKLFRIWCKYSRNAFVINGNGGQKFEKDNEIINVIPQGNRSKKIYGINYFRPEEHTVMSGRVETLFNIN